MDLTSGRRLVAAAVTAIATIAAALGASGTAVAAFPGVNGDILFQSNRDTAAGDIYAIPPGGGVARVTTSTSSSDPVYSPDGSRIAFISTNPGGAYQVFLAAPDGSARVALTTGSTAKLEPAFSPNGQEVAFVTNDDNTAENDLEVWAIRVDGTGLRQITENTVPDTSPAWSPDGSRIAFVRQTDIWTMNATGGAETNLTPDSPPGCAPDCYQGPDANPAWHPSGATIAYGHRNTAAGPEGPDIWAMAANGSGKTNLTPAVGAAFTQPAYSPQGDKIAVVGATDTNRDIWVMNADGTGQAPLETNAAVHDINPDWGKASSSPSPTPTPTSSPTPSSSPSPTSSPTPTDPAVRQRQTAGVTVAKKIKPKGRTVILKKAVRTNAGQKATARVRWSPKKSAKGTRGKYASVKTRKSGKVTITTKGKAKRLFVKLRLTAPATPTHGPYRFAKTWKVSR